MRMRFVFRSPSKDKISSPCSTDKFVRAPFLIHYALNNDERATHSRFPLTNAMWRVRGRLTLMLAAAANATATPAPARHLWFTNVTLGVPFATPRTRRASQVIERFSCHPTVAGWRMILGAGSGGKTSSLRSSQGRTLAITRGRLVGFGMVAVCKDPVVTEPTLALVPRAKYRHASAAPLAGLITFRPLHSISLQFRRSPVRLAPTFPFHSFRRPQTAETVRNSGAPKDSRGRDAPHIGQDRQYGRATSSGQDISNSPRCFARARHQHYGARLRLSPRTRQ